MNWDTSSWKGDVSGMQVLYLWEILKGLHPNFGLKIYSNPRNGRYCVLSNMSSAYEPNVAMLCS